MAKRRKKKSLLTILVCGTALGFGKALFTESPTASQKIAKQRRRKKRIGWM